MAGLRNGLVFMIVTPDELELPIGIAPTMKELAEITGRSLMGLYKLSTEVNQGTKRGERAGRHRFVSRNGIKKNAYGRLVKVCVTEDFDDDFDDDDEDEFAEMYDMMIKEYKEVCSK